MTELTTRVLICGAGPAGLTLAIELARRNVPHLVVDRRPGPFVGSRGKGIQPRTLEVFEDLGVVDRILASGGPYPTQLIHLPEGGTREDILTTDVPTTAEPFAQPCMTLQSTTEAILRERHAELGGAILWNAELVGFTQGDGVTARLRLPDGERTVTSDFMAGADGGRSTVRNLLGIGFPGKTLGVRAIVADLELDGLDRHYWHRYNDGDMTRQLSLCPLQGTDLIQLQAPVPHEGEVGTDLPAIARMVAERTGRQDLKLEGVRWVSVYEMNARLADRYRDGRVFLLGDAAHTHPPTGGQGLNTSIQDAYNLGWKMEAVLRGAPDGLLDTYEEERRPVAEAMLGLSTRLLDATRKGDMRRGRETRQLDIGYPGSSLGLEAPERGAGVRAGDRAPDARLRTSDGTEVRLFQLFQGPHWTLLSFEHPPSAEVGARLRATSFRTNSDVCAPAPGHGLKRCRAQARSYGEGMELADDAGTFRAAYGPRHGDRFLVRPDGYVAAVVGDGSHHLLNDYLESFGLAELAPTS